MNTITAMSVFVTVITLVALILVAVPSTLIGYAAVVLAAV